MIREIRVKASLIRADRRSSLLKKPSFRLPKNNRLLVGSLVILPVIYEQ